MLRNFIRSEDLKKYDASIEKYLPKELPDWQVQVNEAFELIKDRIRARQVVARNLMIPLDLNRAPTNISVQNALTSLTKTANFTGLHINAADGFRRFLVEVTAITSGAHTYAFDIQGSNDQNIIDSIEPTNWRTIATLKPAETGETSLIFQDEYNYYRLKLTVTGATPSVAFTASLVETYIDRWVMWQSLSLIYSFMSKEPDDIWTRRAQEAAVNFETAFETYVFTVDADDDNLVTSTDKIESSRQITMMR